MGYSSYFNTLFLKGVNTMQYTKNRPIIKVCTFEVGDKIKTICIDREGDNFSTFTSKDSNVIEKPSGIMSKFLKNTNCLTVHYFKDGVYKYTCRTFSPAYKSSKSMRYDY